MSGTKRSGTDAIQTLDGLIRKHFDKSEERDEQGSSIASISTSDKYGWAKEVEVGLEVVEHRLDEICEEVALDDPHAVTTRYRIRRNRKSSMRPATNRTVDDAAALQINRDPKQPGGHAMLIATSKVLGTALEGVDGNLGTIKDLYFNDLLWTVRYFVVDTGTWLPGRKVLLSPTEVQSVDWPARMVQVPQTKDEIKDSPSIDTDKPVSREHEFELARYFNWPVYWEPDVVSSPTPVGVDVVPTKKAEQRATAGERWLLRSANEVTGYYIKAKDGDIGHVEDLILDDGVWAIRYMVIDTRNWLPGKKVLVPPDWAQSIRWSEKSIHVDLTREAIKNSPEFNPVAPVNRQYEEHLYDYYGREKYWV